MKAQYVGNPLVPNKNNAHLVTVAGGVFYDVEDLLEHIDFQLQTNFAEMHRMAIEEAFDDGANSKQIDVTNVTAAEHDYDALNRIHTAEMTGWVPTPRSTR